MCGGGGIYIKGPYYAKCGEATRQEIVVDDKKFDVVLYRKAVCGVFSSTLWTAFRTLSETQFRVYSVIHCTVDRLNLQVVLEWYVYVNATTRSLT